MKRNEKGAPVLRREDLRGDYKEVRCPKGCGRILFEVAGEAMEPDYLWVMCQRCEQRILPHKMFQAEGESHLLTCVYECKNCGDRYEKDLEGTRERCYGCKKYQNTFIVGRSRPQIQCKKKQEDAA